jgi:hypothetical protein
MSIKTKIAALTLAAAATMTFATSQAQARHFGFIGPAVVGAVLVGTVVADERADDDDYAYRRCTWVRQFNSFGEFIGRVRVCD